MKKILLIALLCFGCNIVNAQTINAQYRAMSYEEMTAPLRDYQNAYYRAASQIDNYFDEAMEAQENEQWNIEKYYLEKMLQKNNQFNGQIIDSESIKKIRIRISQLEYLIKNEED